MADVAHHNLDIDTSADWSETLTWNSNGVAIDLTGWTAIAQARLGGILLFTFDVTVGGTDGTTVLAAPADQLAPLAGTTAFWGITIAPPGAGDVLVMEGWARFQQRVGRPPAVDVPLDQFTYDLVFGDLPT